MRLRDSARFPHPVLGPQTMDYKDGTFNLNLSIEEQLPAGELRLKGELDINCMSLQAMLAEGSAICGLMITCQDTYFDDFRKVAVGSIEVELPAGQVRGPVQVRAVALSAKSGLLLDSEAVSDEFPAGACKVSVGTVIAMTDEIRVEAGLEKLAPLESIFVMKPSDEVPDGTFEVELDSEAIEILASPALFQFISLVREQPMRETLMAAFYLPVVMQVLEVMRISNEFADRRWFAVIMARCGAEGVDLKGDILSTAQKLLDRPMKAFEAAMTRFSA